MKSDRDPWNRGIPEQPLAVCVVYIIASSAHNRSKFQAVEDLVSCLVANCNDLHSRAYLNVLPEW